MTGRGAMLRRMSREGPGTYGHPVMFGFDEAISTKAGRDHFDPFPDGGGYPIGFLERAYETLGVVDPAKVLHLCSGSMKVGVTVDIRPEVDPTIVADCRSVPLPAGTVDWIMADPPYSRDYAANLYGTADAYPLPGEILREASRLLRPGGRVGLLHFQVPMYRGLPLRLVKVYGVSTGIGFAIRAWTVFERRP